jgi:hypothetical protein
MLSCRVSSPFPIAPSHAHRARSVVRRPLVVSNICANNNDPPKFVRKWRDSVRREHSDRKEAVRKVFDACKTFGKDDLDSVIALHKNAVTELTTFMDSSGTDAPWSLKTEHIEPKNATHHEDPDIVIDIFDDLDSDIDHDDDI